MRIRPTSRAFCALFAVSLGGCSLVGLDDVDTVTCEDDNSPCEVLNEGLSGCKLFQCAPGGIGCALAPADWDNDGVFALECASEMPDVTEFDCDDRDANSAPGADERFDGLDNDCDGVLDEDSERPQPTRLADVPEADLDRVAYAASPDGLWMTHAGADRAPAGIVEVNSGLQAESALLDVSCKGGTAGCNIAELVAAPAGSQLLSAFIEFEGCAKGRLRVAGLDVTPGQQALSFPDAACTRTSAGIDLDVAENDCTGAGRGDGARGATRVALTTQVQGSLVQGIVAAIGDAASRDGCGGAPAPLEVLGLWSDGEGRIAATGGGVPVALGMTAGGGPPALLPWNQRGYFVAHADADGVMQLHFVEQLASGGGSCGVDNAELVVATASRSVGGDGADHPALAQGRLGRPCGEADVELGIAWQEGCGGSGRVVFAHLGYALQSGEVCVAGGPTVLAEGDAGGGNMRPSVAFVDKPFVSPAFARPDGDPDPGAMPGGFVVAWVQDEQVLVQRILAADGLPVGSPVVVSGADGPATPQDVALHVIDDTLFATFVGDGGAALFTTAVLEADAVASSM